jgi:hypothetical protein
LTDPALKLVRQRGPQERLRLPQTRVGRACNGAKVTASSYLIELFIRILSAHFSRWLSRQCHATSCERCCVVVSNGFWFFFERDATDFDEALRVRVFGLRNSDTR